MSERKTNDYKSVSVIGQNDSNIELKSMSGKSCDKSKSPSLNNKTDKVRISPRYASNLYSGERSRVVSPVNIFSSQSNNIDEIVCILGDDIHPSFDDNFEDEDSMDESLTKSEKSVRESIHLSDDSSEYNNLELCPQENAILNIGDSEQFQEGEEMQPSYPPRLFMPSEENDGSNKREDRLRDNNLKSFRRLYCTSIHTKAKIDKQRPERSQGL